MQNLRCRHHQGAVRDKAVLIKRFWDRRFIYGRLPLRCAREESLPCSPVKLKRAECFPTAAAVKFRGSGNPVLAVAYGGPRYHKRYDRHLAASLPSAGWLHRARGAPGPRNTRGCPRAARLAVCGQTGPRHHLPTYTRIPVPLEAGGGSFAGTCDDGPSTCAWTGSDLRAILYLLAVASHPDASLVVLSSPTYRRKRRTGGARGLRQRSPLPLSGSWVIIEIHFENRDDVRLPNGRIAVSFP